MTHHVMVVGGFRDKIEAATAIVDGNPRSIVFTRTREGATELAEALTSGGIEAVDLHGNLSQRVRERNLHKFTTGKAKVVVATDVAARGIHVDNVDVVVHFDAPNDPKAYLHRSGRTARAGESGMVVTITTPRQLDEIVRMQSRAGVEVRHHDIRTTPRPMNALVLAESGEKAPAPRKGGSSSGGARRGPGGRGPASRGGYRGGSERTSSYGGSRGSSSYGDRPARRDDRPARTWDERPARSRDDRPARAWDDRPARATEGRSFEQRSADRAARAERRDGYGKPSGRR
jgi:superfamily II DNA/RNA helicase